jgi:hypothetical protein
MTDPVVVGHALAQFTLAHFLINLETAFATV